MYFLPMGIIRQQIFRTHLYSKHTSLGVCLFINFACEYFDVIYFIIVYISAVLLSPVYPGAS